MNAPRFLRAALLGGATLVVLSCGDPTPLGVRGPAADLTGDPISSADLLLKCSPLPDAATTQTIGPEGGVLQVGPHTLSVPPGALDTAVAITAVAPSDTVNRVQFQPEGLTFAQPASLTMSYANCNLPGLPVPKQIAYTTDVLQFLYYVESIDDALSQTVTGQLEHFSTYAVAW